MRSITGLLVGAVFGLFAVGAQATLLTFQGTFLGSQEVPPNGSSASGFTAIEVDTVSDLLTVDATWSGLIGGAAVAAHIHCCAPAGTNINVAVPLSGFPATTSGTYNHVFDLTNSSIYSASFLTSFGGGTAAGAATALIGGLINGRAYVNIHNVTFPGGEIRAQAVAVAVPEPPLLGLAALGVVLLALTRRRPRAPGCGVGAS